MSYQNSKLDLSKLYRIPWSTYNNPNGWIEVTTYCQLACPGCYRGLALPNPERKHFELIQLKKDIDRLIKTRKIKILSIAGGEPLLYPQLNELLAYAKKKGLKTRIVSNGAALTKNRLITLKKLGVVEISVHIANYQKRTRLKGEKQLNKLREYYCQIFREVKGVELDFIITVSKTNIGDLPSVINFYQKNSDVVSRAIFTIYRDVFFKKPQEEDKTNYVKPKSLINLIDKTYGAKPCAYLGKKLDKKSISWLFFAPILLGSKPIAYADSKTVQNLFSQDKNKTWNSFPVRDEKPNLAKSLSIISFPTLIKILAGAASALIHDPKSILNIPRAQIIIILNTPTLTEKGWDLCDGCPNAILYKNKLVPSCLLERIKLGENISL